ncbi:MAG: InlB B-repeat-containing protein, partial [Prevotellaceae bacterium]|nr:InlB B-repeat-containing protein [Prevotellaceae bacterium]
MLLRKKATMQPPLPPLLLAAAFFCFMGAPRAQTVASGTTGDCTWTITGSNTNDLTFTVSGSGAMRDYKWLTASNDGYTASTPWCDYMMTPSYASYASGYITSVVITQGVTKIGDYTIMNLRASSITLPASITSIGTETFNSCSLLTTIFCLNPTPPSIVGSISLFTQQILYVPLSALSAYQNTAWWKNFASIRPYTYTITYNANNGSDIVTSSLHSYTETKMLSENTFTHTGYHFTGWATSPTSGVVYNDRQDVLNLSATPDDVIPLYAVWAPNTYTVAYNGNGNTGGATVGATHTYDAEQALTSNGFTKTGYRFTGWNTKDNGSGTSYSAGQGVINMTTLHNGAVTLHAQWAANTYTVEYGYVEDDASGATTSSAHAYDEPKALSLNGFARPGYAFAGWTTNPL